MPDIKEWLLTPRYLAIASGQAALAVPTEELDVESRVGTGSDAALFVMVAGAILSTWLATRLGEARVPGLTADGGLDVGPLVVVLLGSGLSGVLAARLTRISVVGSAWYAPVALAAYLTVFVGITSADDLKAMAVTVGVTALGLLIGYGAWQPLRSARLRLGLPRRDEQYLRLPVAKDPRADGLTFALAKAVAGGRATPIERSYPLDPAGARILDDETRRLAAAGYELAGTEIEQPVAGWRIRRRIGPSYSTPRGVPTTVATFHRVGWKGL
jgi:hypothetical protein